MKNKVVLGVVLLAAAIGAFFLFGRRAETPTAPVAEKPTTAAPGKAAAPGPRPSSESGGEGGSAPPEVALDYEDDPAGALRLEGQVIDAEERPVGRAVVTLSSNPPRTIKSEADGSFVFDKLVGRTYSVAARKDDDTGGPVTVRLTGKTEPVVIRLAPAGGVEVTVVDQKTRKPVAGADVEIDPELEVQGRTGADGKVTLRGVQGGWQDVTARADGYAPAHSFLEVTGKAGVTDKVTVELQQGAAVSGKVVDATGKPVEGARVRAVAASALFGIGQGGKKDEQITNAAGAFTFPALPAGTFRITASHEKHGPGSSPPLNLDGQAARRDVVVTLEAGGRVSGKVVRSSGDAVASAAVRVVMSEAGWTWAPTRQVFTDDHGKFEITGLARKPVELVAIEEEASSKTVPLDLAAKPEQTDVTLTLDIEGVIAGTVVTASGEPVPEAQVLAMPELGRRMDPSEFRLRGPAQDVTDSGGKFELKGLVEGTYRLRAARAKRSEERMWMREATAAKVGDKNVKIVLQNDGKVKGSVLFADGSAPESFNVSAGFGHGEPFSGEGGKFEIDAQAGKVVLTVNGAGFVNKTVTGVEVKPDETTDVGTITVEKGRSISGRVLRPDGSGVAGAKVLAGGQLMGSGSELSSGGLFGGAPGQKSATTGDDGSFVLAGVNAKGLVVVADHPTEGRSSMVRIPAGDASTTLDLVLKPLGALEGKVTSGGKPMASSIVLAMPQQAARGNFIVQSGEDGTYRYDKLAPDTYRVTAVQRGGPMGGAMHSKVVTVEAEKTVHLDLEVPASGVKVTMKVKPPEGVTLTTAQVFLVSGSFTAPTADVFNEKFGELGPGSTHQGFMLKAEPVKFENVEPGPYSACAIPIPGDINSPADMMKLRDSPEKLLVACQPVTIAKDPAEQEVTVTVPAPPPL